MGGSESHGPRKLMEYKLWEGNGQLGPEVVCSTSSISTRSASPSQWREKKSSAKVESETRIPPDERVILAAILEELKAQNGAAGGKPPTSELPET